MLQVLGMVVALCAGCGDPQEPRGLRIAIPDPIVDLGVSDGCARFQVRFDAGGAPIVEPIFNSASCALNQIRLLSDTAATFDAATGALRVAIVMENLGTAAIVPRVQLRFNADSVTRLDANGNPVGGANDILGYQPDSASANGRVAFWRFDGYLAPAGQPQVLMPGARTQRRWVEFRGTTWSHRTRLKLFATGAEVGAVPAVPPDTLPALFYADSNIVSAPALSRYRFVRDVIWIWFKNGTAGSARAAVINSIGGTVVGGYRIGSSGGAYAVRLPRDPTHQSIFAAVNALRSNQAVALVDIEVVFDGVGAYRRAADATGWQGSDFKLSPDSGFAPAANRPTAALTAINAPMAWGCSVGDTAVNVAVVDVGLHTTGLTDLLRNLRSASGANLPNNPDRHGTAVSMLLAARGNDSVSMTGVAWRAGLSLYDATMLVSGVPQLLPNGKSKSTNVLSKAGVDRAVIAGARVINLSLGIDTAASGVLTDTALLNQGARFAAAMKQSLVYAPADTPLFVVAAGNNHGADPAHSYYPFIKDSLPNHTLVVTAAARSLGVAFYGPPNNSRIVPDIAAPGEQVYSVDSPNTAVVGDGTSFSAPQVSGVATLLVAFDSSLTMRQVRTLLTQGAVRGGRVAGQYPILNAYESLKLAAERPGAPLCGNRMWSNGNQLLVRRGTATEVIGTSTLLEPTIESYHGGRVAGFGGVRFLWQPNGSWAAGTLPGGSIPSGAWRSSVGASHDGDSTVYTTIGPVPVGGGHFDVIVDHYAGAALLSSRTVTSGNAGANTPVLAHVAYPTTGNTALVAVARGTITLPLPSPPVIALDAGTAYGLSLSTGQVSTLWVESGRGILAVGYSEDGSEIVSVVSNAYNFVGQPLVAMPSCKVTWRKVSAPAVVIDSASTPYGCQIDPIAGARTGGSAPRILPRRP